GAGGLQRGEPAAAPGYWGDANGRGDEEGSRGVGWGRGGWGLHRLDTAFVQHFGYQMNAYALLMRR
ncbi:MAG: glycosyltransferase family 2 protein, partial [Candidatus Devosia euplotis]|nr:glycosyltransferase family 2 protein [Candidatus Devosia euplotis]